MGHVSRVRLGAAFAPAELDERDHYLTARFNLWVRNRGLLVRTPVEHPAWELRRVSVEDLREDLLLAAGLPEPRGEPLVHYSDGADVRIGWPRPEGASRRP